MFQSERNESSVSLDLRSRDLRRGVGPPAVIRRKLAPNRRARAGRLLDVVGAPADLKESA